MTVEDIWRKDTNRPRGTLAVVIHQVTSGGFEAEHIRWVHPVYPLLVALHRRPLGATRVSGSLLGAWDEKNRPADCQGARDS